MDEPHLLTASHLLAQVKASAGCPHCQELRCAGWESISSPLGAPLLQPLGTLRDPDIEEPTLEELHLTLPEGRTHLWHVQAPLALRLYPCNRCNVWRCPHCHRGFLQYTETGGYYVDHRVRAIDPALVVDG